jgi:hypothetical protein
MDNRAIPPQLKALLLCGAGLLLAILAGWNIGSANYEPIVLGVLIVLGLSLLVFTGPFFWVVTIASSFLSGTFPILGGAFTPFHILMLIGVAKFLIEDIVLRRARIKVGDGFDLLMIAGFMAVLTLHALHDRFGMRFLGSSVWGGRNYVNVYVGLTAFFVIQSIPMKPKVWAKFPYMVLAVTTFDLIIAVITTLFPASIYKIYPFYSAVSLPGVEELITGESGVTGRVGTFGSFGFVLIIVVLASTSLQQILSPKNLLRFICLVGGFVAVLFSGFRSAILNVVIGFLAAGIRDLKFAAFALLPFLAVVLFGLSFANSQIVHLPKQIQRGLAFIPGKWDTEMARNAAASNDYRMRIWTLWARQYFPVHPWLGRGFGFQSEWAKPAMYKGAQIDYRQEVEIGNIHNGLFATLDTFGIVGTIFFVVWVLHILAGTFRVSFRTADAGGTALRFLALYLAVWIISYWFGAKSVGSFLPLQFALAGVFRRLRHAMASDTIRIGPAKGKVQQDVREELAPV